ncbi:MAG: hypothetical protein V4503_09700 [Gemmatimonadota bacterium]
MQTLVQVICTRGRSLRDAIVNDPRLAAYQLDVAAKLRPGRSQGWAKLHSTIRNRRGALNLEWDGDTAILLCRVVNRGAARPHLILGDFVEYLFHRHRKRIEAVNIIPR